MATATLRADAAVASKAGSRLCDWPLVKCSVMLNEDATVVDIKGAASKPE
jgi:hypothetical protein